MPVYKIADLKVGYEPKYERLRSRSEKYRCDGDADFIIGVTDNVVAQTSEQYEATPELMEYLFTGTAFNLKLLEYDGFFLHSSNVVVDGKSYAFSAPCGTGKSTHTALWLKLLGDKAFIINDDKGIFRKHGDKYYTYGAPFSGKYDMSVNTSAVLDGICFIEQSPTNSIERMDIDDAVPLLISQTARPEHPQRMILMCDRIDDLVRTVPIYKLKCNMELDAARLSYDTMSKHLL